LTGLGLAIPQVVYGGNLEKEPPKHEKSHLQWIIWMIGFVDGKTYLLVLKWLSFEMALTFLLSLFKGCCIMNPANALTGQVVT